MSLIRSLPLLVMVVSWVGELMGQTPNVRFDHQSHRKLFPSCLTCHVGAEREGEPLWPTPGNCAECHDGTIRPKVTWSPPTDHPATNLRFGHLMHRQAVARGRDGRPAGRVDCTACHQVGRTTEIRRTIPQQCLDCHQIDSHFDAPPTTCAQCHRTLTEATDLSPERVRRFPTPASHRDPDFLWRGPKGHGAQATVGGTGTIAASCATCHARDFCLNCHVDAPERPSIQALGRDDRSAAVKPVLPAPRSHQDPDFSRRHARMAGSDRRACATCHTRESCQECHIGRLVNVIGKLPARGAGRATGAMVRRMPPATHGPTFSDRHSALANAAPASCATCHVRTQCLDCHRPDPAQATGYHPANFLARHPAAAFSRQTSCGDCHNVQRFCASCHQQSGLTTTQRLGTSRFHDGKRFFLVGHGKAARQSLESCVSCHVERDCLACHSAAGGRRFNPHGPGFNPKRLRKKNREMCVACHGNAIP